MLAFHDLRLFVVEIQVQVAKISYIRVNTGLPERWVKMEGCNLKRTTKGIHDLGN
jgi:hypothetical protein